MAPPASPPSVTAFAIDAYLSFDEAFWTVKHLLERPSLVSQFSLNGVCVFFFK